VQYILTDGKSLNSLPSATLVWSKGVYNLWMVPNEHWIFISSMRSLKGIDDTDGEHIFWLGQDETEIRLVSAGDGQAVISADFMRGPGWPEHQGRTMLVSTDQRDSSIVVVADDGPRTLSVPIVAGRNRIILRPQPMVRAGFLPDAEQAPLLFGLRGLKVRLESDAR
jgi:hypothetical protein